MTDVVTETGTVAMASPPFMSMRRAALVTVLYVVPAGLWFGFLCVGALNPSVVHALPAGLFRIMSFVSLFVCAFAAMNQWAVRPFGRAVLTLLVPVWRAYLRLVDRVLDVAFN